MMVGLANAGSGALGRGGDAAAVAAVRSGEAAAAAAAIAPAEARSGEAGPAAAITPAESAEAEHEVAAAPAKSAEAEHEVAAAPAKSAEAEPAVASAEAESGARGPVSNVAPAAAVAPAVASAEAESGARGAVSNPAPAAGVVPARAAHAEPPPAAKSEPTSAVAAGNFDRNAEGFGLGIVLGLPTGVSLAYRPGGRVWYDGALGWSFDHGTSTVQGDVLLTLADLRTDDIPDVDFPVYLGVGPRLRLGDSPYVRGRDFAELGIRVPIGMAFIHDRVPLEAFVELAPGIDVYPTTQAIFDAAIGGRYYFP
jgi:hypothetical protein